jgi:hypothetical protein
MGVLADYAIAPVFPRRTARRPIDCGDPVAADGVSDDVAELGRRAVRSPG